MPAGVEAILAFLLAGILALLLVPLTDRLARRIGAIDLPRRPALAARRADAAPRWPGDLRRGPRRRPDLAALGRRDPGDPHRRGADHRVGVLDDVYELGAAPKLLGQTVAVIVPVSAGVTVDSFTVPFLGQLNPGSVELLSLPGGGAIDLGDVGTTIGIVAMINVINLIDGVDGLAAGVCVDLRRRPRGDRPLARPQRRRRARRAHRRRRARLPPPRLPARRAPSWGTPAPTCSASCSASSRSRER